MTTLVNISYIIANYEESLSDTSSLLYEMFTLINDNTKHVDIITLYEYIYDLYEKDYDLDDLIESFWDSYEDLTIENLVEYFGDVIDGRDKSIIDAKYNEILYMRRKIGDSRTNRSLYRFISEAGDDETASGCPNIFSNGVIEDNILNTMVEPDFEEIDDDYDDFYYAAERQYFETSIMYTDEDGNELVATIPSTDEDIGFNVWGDSDLEGEAYFLYMPYDKTKYSSNATRNSILSFITSKRYSSLPMNIFLEILYLYATYIVEKGIDDDEIFTLNKTAGKTNIIGEFIGTIEGKYEYDPMGVWISYFVHIMDVYVNESVTDEGEDAIESDDTNEDEVYTTYEEDAYEYVEKYDIIYDSIETVVSGLISSGYFKQIEFTAEDIYG